MFTKFFVFILILNFSISVWSMDAEENRKVPLAIQMPDGLDDADSDGKNARADSDEFCTFVDSEVESKGCLRKNLGSNLLICLEGLSPVASGENVPSLQRGSSDSVGCPIPGFSEFYDLGREKVNHALSKKEEFMNALNGILGDKKISGDPIFQTFCEEGGRYHLTFTMKR